MTVATALVSDNDPLPILAEDAVRQALDKSGLTHAYGVLVFLPPVKAFCPADHHQGYRFLELMNFYACGQR